MRHLLLWCLYSVDDLSIGTKIILAVLSLMAASYGGGSGNIGLLVAGWLGYMVCFGAVCLHLCVFDLRGPQAYRNCVVKPNRDY